MPSSPRNLHDDKATSSSSSASPEPLSIRDSVSQMSASVLQDHRYRSLVKIDGDIIRVSESRRQVSRSEHAERMACKYNEQLEEAMRYQIAAGDGAASHLRGRGSRTPLDASGRHKHVTQPSRRIPCGPLKPKVTQRPPKQVEQPKFGPNDPEIQDKSTALLPTPPPTPKASRLPTPELPPVKQDFCICVVCIYLARTGSDQ